jgi:hypothetical protein
MTENLKAKQNYSNFIHVHGKERCDVAIHLTGFTHGLLLPTSRDRNDEVLESILDV